MHPQPHLVPHEAIEQLPLLTKSARVTDVVPMDTDRTDEVTASLGELLQSHEKLNVMVQRNEGDGFSNASALATVLETEARNATLARTLRTLLERYERPYPSLFRIRLRTDTAIDFIPGQYIGIRYRGIPRVYSIASVPQQSELELCVRRVPGGRLTTQLATDLDIGDQLTVRGPYGDLALEGTSDRDLAFFATGTGVAPFKSMITALFHDEWDVHEDDRRDIWLFLGAGWKDDLPYRDEFRALANEHANFHFVPTLSRERYLTDWNGETAYVQNVFLKYLDEDSVQNDSLPHKQEQYLDRSPRYDIEARLDPRALEVYVCGLNAMVYNLVDTIKQIGVSENHIQLEGYG